MVDRIARRIEGTLQQKESVIDKGTIEEAAPRGPALSKSPAESSTVELVEAALKETRELVRIEVALAKLEAKKQIKDTAKAAIGFGVAVVLGIICLAMVAVALALALGGTAASALLIAAIVLALGAAAAFIGYSKLPRHPLERTRHNLEDDFKQLKEHVA